MEQSRLIRNQPKYPLFEVILRAQVHHANKYFKHLYDVEPKKFKLVFFSSEASTYVKWSEVKRRRILLHGFLDYELLPFLRVNLILAQDWIPVEVVISTLIEELVHLHLGFDKSDPHDQEFYDMVMKCPEFAEGLLWKEKNVLKVIHFINNGEIIADKVT